MSLFRRHPALLLVLSAMFFAVALNGAVLQRHETRQLHRQLAALQQETRVLQDEHRSLQLEYAALTDYAKLRDAASALNMREPRLEDGSLVFAGKPSAGRAQ